MDIRECPSRGGRETVAAQPNNALPDIQTKLSVSNEWVLVSFAPRVIGASAYRVDATAVHTSVRVLMAAPLCGLLGDRIPLQAFAVLTSLVRVEMSRRRRLVSG